MGTRSSIRVISKSTDKETGKVYTAKHMLLYNQMDGYPEGIPVNENTAKAFGIEFGTTVKVRPYLAMLDAQGYIVSGWLASMTDMLSTDWEIQE